MKKYDLIVVGGGLSGVCATISAARQGLKVLLIEKSNCLGGAATNGLVIPFMPTNTVIGGEKIELCRGIFAEIKEKLKRLSAIEWDSFGAEELKLILNRMVRESGADIIFHASLVDTAFINGKITSATFNTIEGKITLDADYFIDATGNAQLAYLANLPYTLGREKDNLCQPMTLSLRLGGVDENAFFGNISDLNKEYKKQQKEGKILNPRENILAFKTTQKGIVHLNTTRIVRKNPTSAKELTEAEIEAREQAYEIYRFIKENAKGAENSYILSTGSEIGVRESRKILGEYTLTGKEARECAKFDDSIAVSNYDIDIHNPEGTGTSHHYFKNGEYFEIPYRTLIPKGTENILVVGRCISCDHEAQASIRIMPIISCIGEAGGCAIALAKKQGVPTSKIDIKELQEKLKANDLFI